MIQVERMGKDLHLTVYTMVDPKLEVHDGYSSDLLSDVMGNAEEGSALITIQAHKNTVAVASLLGLPAIILCNGRTPSDDMIEAAEKEKISILGTDDNQFTVSYRLAQALEKHT